MMPLKQSTIRIFSVFAEDSRKSVEIYAARVSSVIAQIEDKTHVRTDLYTPKLPLLFKIFPNTLNIRMRVARYVLYPLLFFFRKRDLNHIVDHAYGQLLLLPPRSKNVVTVHDLIPLLAWKGLIKHEIYPTNPLLFRASLLGLRKADKIIAVSQSTKDDLVRLCNIDERNVVVIHHGIHESFRMFSAEEKTLARLRHGFNDPNAIYILIIGEQKYKNHAASFEIAKSLQERNERPIQLVWLGGNAGALRAAIDQAPLEHEPLMFQSLSLEDVVSLYNSVDFLLFPSLYEGFGFPPLEAMACGVPVFCSNIPALQEVLTDAAISKPPGDIKGFVNALDSVIGDGRKRRALIEAGLRQSRKYSWATAGQQIYETYTSLLKGP